MAQYAKLVLEFNQAVDGDSISFDLNGVREVFTFLDSPSGGNEVLTGGLSVLANSFYNVINPQPNYSITLNGREVTILATIYDDNLNFGLISIEATDIVVIERLDNEFTPILVESTVTNVLCNGSSTGAISLNIISGDAPFTFLWNDGNQDEDRLNIPAGNYEVIITDVNGGSETFSNILVSEPDAIAVEAKLIGNSIELTVSGGVPDYSYIWSNGSVTKDISNLQPGDYTVTITDDNGCTEEVTITVPDFRFYFSQNPVPLVLTASDAETKPNLSFVNEVWIQKDYPLGDFELVATEEHLSDSNYGTAFRGETYLDAFLEPYVPDVNLDSIVLAQGLFKLFHYRHTERFGNPPADANYTQVDQNVVLLGGLSDIEFAANTFFESYLSTKKPFLNWETSPKSLLPDQPDYLYYLVNSFDQIEIHLKVKLYWTDGTDQTITKYTKLGIATRYEVYCFPIGFSQLNLEAVDDQKEVYAYDVWIEDQVDVVVSEIRRYEIDRNYYPYKRFLLYLSSLGGMSTVAITGKAEKKVKMTQEVIEKHLPYNFTIDDLGQKVTYSKGTPKIKFNSGYITDQEFFERLEDFIQSEFFYLMDNNRWIPVRVEADGTPLFDETRQDALNVLSGTIYLPEQRRYTPQL